jgi:hypothetical protein
VELENNSFPAEKCLKTFPPTGKTMNTNGSFPADPKSSAPNDDRQGICLRPNFAIPQKLTSPLWRFLGCCFVTPKENSERNMNLHQASQKQKFGKS